MIAKRIPCVFVCDSLYAILCSRGLHRHISILCNDFFCQLFWRANGNLKRNQVSQFRLTKRGHYICHHNKKKNNFFHPLSFLPHWFPGLAVKLSKRKAWNQVARSSLWGFARPWQNELWGTYPMLWIRKRLEAKTYQISKGISIKVFCHFEIGQIPKRDQYKCFSALNRLLASISGAKLQIFSDTEPLWDKVLIQL